MDVYANGKPSPGERRLLERTSENKSARAIEPGRSKIFRFGANA